MNEELHVFIETLKAELIKVIEDQLIAPEKQLLTLNEATQYLGVSYNTLQKFRRNGLKFFEVDGVKRVYKKDLDHFIEKNSF